MASSIKLSPLSPSSASPPSITTSPPPPTTTQQQPLLSETHSSQQMQPIQSIQQNIVQTNIVQTNKVQTNKVQTSSDFNPSPVPLSIDIPTQPPSVDINTETPIQIKNVRPIKSVSAPTPKMTETIELIENVQINKPNIYLQIIAALILSLLVIYLIRFFVLKYKMNISDLYLNIGLGVCFILLFVLLYYLINKFV